MSLSVTVAAMVAAGCSPEQIAVVVAAHEAKVEADTAARREAKREGNRDRQRARRQREAPPDHASHAVTARDKRDPVSPEVSPQEIYNQPPILTPSPERVTREAPQAISPEARQSEFEYFYRAYPKHENRKDALSRYRIVIKSGVNHSRVMAGLDRWRNKWHADSTERQFIPAPDVWLNKRKFDDDPVPNGPRANKVPFANPYGTRNGKISLGQEGLRRVAELEASRRAREDLFGGPSDEIRRLPVQLLPAG